MYSIGLIERNFNCLNLMFYLSNVKRIFIFFEGKEKLGKWKMQIAKLNHRPGGQGCRGKDPETILNQVQHRVQDDNFVFKDDDYFILTVGTRGGQDIFLCGFPPAPTGHAGMTKGVKKWMIKWKMENEISPLRSK